MIFTPFIIAQIVCTVILSTLFASFFEWCLHRYVMHKPLGTFDYAFRGHVVVHHSTFRADRTYHLINKRDKRTIPMAWWNGPVLIALTTVLFTPVIGMLFDVPYAWVFVGATFGTYYLAYEYMHWCMHLPLANRLRLFERMWPFSRILFRLNGHHLLHHRYMQKNFNVVLPLADWCLGTLLPRAAAPFDQPTGPLVPDVQPKTAV